MTMNFGEYAGQGSDFDLLPKGLIVWAILQVRGVQTSATPSRYLDVELTVDQNQPFAGRKLWDKIGDPFFPSNSEKYRQMGQVAITRILEAGRNAGPNNPAGYQLNDFSELSGLRVAIKVGVEDGTDGHDDKNRVSDWLTPNPASQSGYKGYQKLMNGDHGLPKTDGGQQQGAATGFGGFGGQPQTQQQVGGFGGSAAGAPSTQQPVSGFGTGFQQPPADSSGQSGANGAGTAGTTQGDAHASPPSNQPGQTPGWLEQAGGEQAAT